MGNEMSKTFLTALYASGRCVCLCSLVTTVSLAEMAEPIKMPFGVWTQKHPTNHILERGPDPPREVQFLFFGGGMWPDASLITANCFYSIQCEDIPNTNSEDHLPNLH